MIPEKTNQTGNLTRRIVSHFMTCDFEPTRRIWRVIFRMQRHMWLKFRLQYIGSKYIGWQRQATDSTSIMSPAGMVVHQHLPSVQSVVESLMRSTFLDDSLVVSAVSRTDTGVNANDQVAYLRLGDTHLHMLQSHLDQDIQILPSQTLLTSFTDYIN